MLAAEDWREIRGHGCESGPVSVEGGIGLVHDLVEGDLGEGLAEAMVGEVSIAPDLVDDAEGGDAEVGPLAGDMRLGLSAGGPQEPGIRSAKRKRGKEGSSRAGRGHWLSVSLFQMKMTASIVSRGPWGQWRRVIPSLDYHLTFSKPTQSSTIISFLPGCVHIESWRMRLERDERDSWPKNDQIREFTAYKTHLTIIGMLLSSFDRVFATCMGLSNA